jgi:hypothetical protein
MTFLRFAGGRAGSRREWRAASALFRLWAFRSCTEAAGLGSEPRATKAGVLECDGTLSRRRPKSTLGRRAVLHSPVPSSKNRAS